MLKCLLRKTPLLGLMVVLLEACNPTGNGSDGRQVFRFNDASGILTLDPAFAKDQSHIWASMLFYNGLVRFDDRLRAVPCIANSWEILDSGTTYRFHLRTDVFFHAAPELPKEAAGRMVVADDFVYSLHRLTDPAVASPGRWVMRPVDQDSSGTHLSITAENDSTLLIQLRHPFPPFLSLLAMPYCAVVQKEAVQYF
ncbi:MAG TPA: ABC transporter substrate-binding protein, partial [Bacteroidia bacterium]|nr:ABC transporter substrate-binding protein [Bacteroidia bacterium]